MYIVCYYLKFYCYFQEKIDTIHEQVIRGDIRHVRNLLDKKGWANARDHYGHSPLHKSIMANQEEIMRFILGTYPDHVEDRDNVIGFLFFKESLLSLFLCSEVFTNMYLNSNSFDLVISDDFSSLVLI